MWWAIIKCVKVLLTGVFVGLVFSTSVHAWSASAPPEFLLSNLKVSDPYPCSENYGTISVSGEGSIDACIMGQNTRIASYLSVNGQPHYAVSFPSDNVFYRLDVCVGSQSCVYAEATDTFIATSWNSPTIIYKNFVRNLSKSVQRGVVWYGLSSSSPSFPLVHPDGSQFIGQVAAVSSNGKWLLIEVREYGLFRISTQTLEVRRIAAPGYTYNRGNEPRAELAITNNGNTAAIMGYRLGVTIISVDDSCGDRPNLQMVTYHIGAVTPCVYIPVSTGDLVQSFWRAARPRFSQNGSSLSFDVYGYSGLAKHVTLFSSQNSTQNNISRYLAIGDSFTSGEGEANDSFYIGGATNRCHVSNRSYPYLLATAWAVDGFNASCSGATMATARGHDLRAGQPAQLSEIEVRLPQLLTVGIGGNDAGLMGKLKSCLGLGTCEWANTPEKRLATALEIKRLYASLGQFYKHVVARTPGKVIAVGYPRIISTQPSCSGVGILLDQAERRFMDESIRYLNLVIQAASNDSKVEYVDVADAFNGSELCSSHATSMNAIRLGSEYPIINVLSDFKVIGAESFHPTPTGHELIKRAILQIFPSSEIGESCTTCSAPRGAPQPSAYWDSEGSAPRELRAQPFIDTVLARAGDLIKLYFPAFSFQPLSAVALELHSDVKNLGTVMAAQDGSLSVNIEANDFGVGFHSIHALGKSFAGIDVDVYDFLTIESKKGALATSSSASAVGSGVVGVIAGSAVRAGPGGSVGSTALTSIATPYDVLGAVTGKTLSNGQTTGSQRVSESSAGHLATGTKLPHGTVVVIALIAGGIFLGIVGCMYYRAKRP